MPRLILLNGPPGIGKSTIAARYVADHPGVLDLDVDQVRSLIGGWRDDFAGAGALVRPIALAMARTHLGAGHDVVMPQFLGRLSEIARFEAEAVATGADFVEVVLMDDLEPAIERFDRRSRDGEHAWHREVAAIVAADGGRDCLVRMHDQLRAVCAARSGATIVPTRAGDIDGTYAHVLAVLRGH